MHCTRTDLTAITNNLHQQFYSTLLRHSQTLKILTDVGESHALHATEAFSSRANVKTMMLNVPNLHKLVTVDRIWTVRVLALFYLRI